MDHTPAICSFQKGPVDAGRRTPSPTGSAWDSPERPAGQPRASPRPLKPIWAVNRGRSPGPRGVPSAANELEGPRHPDSGEALSENGR